jgi:hypothetical protein
MGFRSHFHFTVRTATVSPTGLVIRRDSIRPTLHCSSGVETRLVWLGHTYSLSYKLRTIRYAMRWPSHRKVAVTLIAIGLIPLLHSLYLGLSDNFEVLRISVRLTPGQFESPEFKTDLNGTYLLELDFDRMKNPLNMDCRIGIPVFPRDCAGIRQTINFYWKVVSREKGITAQGTYKVLAYGGDGVIFGQFQGRRGARERVYSILSKMRVN